MGEEEKKVCVTFEDLSSQEYMYLGDNKIRAVFTGINGKIYEGDILGISASDEVAPKVLSEVIACIRPYYDGKCTLLDYGIMQQKRVLLPHVFFLDSANVLYPNMTVLEYLMFVTAQRSDDDVDRQQMLLDMLERFDLGYVALSQMPVLSDAEKIIISTLCGYLTDSKIVVLNLCEYNMRVSEIETFNGILRAIAQADKCVIIATNQASIVGMCCTKALYLSSGKVGYFGNTNGMVEKYDRVKVVITDRRAATTISRLQELFVEYDFQLEDKNTILVSVRNVEEQFYVDNFVTELTKFNLLPDAIKLNQGRVKNSFEEIDKIIGL